MLSLLMLVMKDGASNVFGVTATTVEDSQAVPMDKDALVHAAVRLHLIYTGVVFQPAVAVFPLRLGEDASRVLYPKDLPRASHRCTRGPSPRTRTSPRTRPTALLSSRYPLCCTRYALRPHTTTTFLQHHQAFFQLECVLFLWF
jgi:hypothetical protein